ncbi:MAG: chemotaxis protein CheW [Myxococcaceae bacterium]|nr:chemotaxis protein CheW [Myxococcaceae bacterium]
MSEAVQLCVLLIDGQDYVIDLMRVEEILRAPVVTTLPRAKGVVHGVVSLRGTIVPVVDVRRRLSKQGSAALGSENERLVVCRIGSRRVGLLVDGVSAVLRVSRSVLKPAPRMSEADRQPFVLGVCEASERLRLMLDVRALMEDAT